MSLHPTGLLPQPRASAMGRHMAITTGEENEVSALADQVPAGAGAGLSVAQLEECRRGRARQVRLLRAGEQVVDQLARSLCHGFDLDALAGSRAVIAGVEPGGHLLDPVLFLRAIGEEEAESLRLVERRDGLSAAGVAPRRGAPTAARGQDRPQAQGQQAEDKCTADTSFVSIHHHLLPRGFRSRVYGWIR